MRRNDRPPGPPVALRIVGGPLLLFVGLLLVYSVLAPAYRGPDEPQHYDLAREWSLDAEYEGIERQLSEAIIDSLPLVRFGSRSQNLEQAEAPPRGDRPALDEGLWEADSDSFNQISRHPPLYSVVVGSSLAVVDLVEPGGRWAFDRELAIVRLIGVALLAPLPWLLARSVSALGLPDRAAFITALVPSGIPQLTHIGSVVNNDNLMTIFGAIVTFSVARVVAGHRGWRWNLVAGLALGGAFMTKASAPVLVFGAGLGYLLAWWRARASVRRIWTDTWQVGVPALALGVWWYAWAVLEYGDLQPAGQKLLPDAPPGFDPDPGLWFERFSAWLPERTIGNFGWLELGIGDVWVAGAFAFLGLGVLLSITMPAGRFYEPGRSFTRVTAVLFFLPFVVIVALVAQNSWSGYVRKAAFPAIQGRYLFLALPFVAVCIGAGYGRLRGWLGDLAVLVTVAWVAAMQWKGTTTMLGYYWGPPAGSLRDQIAAMVTWSPWPAAVTTAFAGVAAAGAALTLVDAARCSVAARADGDGGSVGMVEILEPDLDRGESDVLHGGQQ